MQAAHPVLAFVPDRCDLIDGVHWLSFLKDGTYDTFSAMPEVLMHQSLYYKRMSHNSDTGWIHYKEIPFGMLAVPLK